MLLERPAARDQDPTGSSVSGYLHEELVEEYGPDLVAGFAIALHKVSSSSSTTLMVKY